MRLQAALGNQVVQRMLIQRFPEAEMWDNYLDAYSGKMRYKKTSDLDATWLNRFRELELALYDAKENGGGVRYQATRVQDAYGRLLALGFEPVEAGEDPDAVEGRNVLAAANGRFQAFSGNPHMNRGAWAGSTSHGAQPNDYLQTAAGVIAALRNRQRLQGGRLGSWWLMQSDSSPSGYSLHRGRIDVRGDFIYHL
jgi:hypothetical protein